MTDKKPLGLYLHIPFCQRKCAYCDFYSAFYGDKALDSYTEGLISQIKNRGGRLCRPLVDTVYFGGGTPSLLGERIIPLIGAVKEAFCLADNAEITLEVNPAGNAGNTLLAAKRAGINRLSVGAQSGDNAMLTLLGRTHTAEDTLKTVKTAREFGDLSENFEYKSAKREKNRNDSRIRYLERMIKTAKVIDVRSNADEIGLFDKVTIYIEEDDEEQTIELVTTLRQNALKGLISKESPVGKAVLGHKVGDRVTVQVNENYSYDIVIRAVEKGQDDASLPISSY